MSDIEVIECLLDAVLTRCQEPFATDVTEGVDVTSVSVLVLIHLNVTTVVELDTLQYQIPVTPCQIPKEIT